MKLTTTAVLVFIGATMASPSPRPSEIFSRDDGTSLEKRGCAVRKFGCEYGYCWRKCNADTGGWCWLAFNQGRGDWVTCTTDASCDRPVGGDIACGDTCGCNSS